MRKIVCAILSITCLVALTYGKGDSMKKKADIMFEGTVLQIGPSVPPTGVLTHYRLAKYRVERVCRGNYAGKEIIVDHFSLTGRELESVKVGDRVFVAVDKNKEIQLREDVAGLRESTDVVETYYIGGGVAPPDTVSGSCTDKAISGLRLNVQRLYSQR